MQNVLISSTGAPGLPVQNEGARHGHKVRTYGDALPAQQLRPYVHHQAGAHQLVLASHIPDRAIFFIIDRFELSIHYIRWKLFWQISYRKDTLLKGVPNSCSKRQELNLHGAPHESDAKLILKTVDANN